MTGIPYLLLSFSLLTSSLTPSSLASNDWGSLSFPAASTLPQVQNTSNAITGVVTNTAGQPLNRMRVELLDEVEMFIKQTYTDGTGRYSFKNLSSGTFIVRVHSDGVYVEKSDRVTIYALRDNGGSHNEQHDIVLKSRDEMKKPSGPNNSGPTFAQEVPDNARKVYERAVKQLENDAQADQGMASLKEAITIFPKYYLALERLGIEQVKRQEYVPARETLEKAIKVNANSASCLYALGVVQYQARQWPESVESLRRSLVLAPSSPNAAFAHFYLGLGFIKTGKPAEAEPHLKKACELGANSIPADVHMHLAQIYSNTKRYKEAADELELFLKQVPDARDAENIKNIVKQLRAKAKTGSASSS